MCVATKLKEFYDEAQRSSAKAVVRRHGNKEDADAVNLLK